MCNFFLTCTIDNYVMLKNEGRFRFLVLLFITNLNGFQLIEFTVIEVVLESNATLRTSACPLLNSMNAMSTM